LLATLICRPNKLINEIASLSRRNFRVIEIWRMAEIGAFRALPWAPPRGKFIEIIGVPKGIRTPVTAVKGRITGQMIVRLCPLMSYN